MASLPAEALGASGLVAAVAAGLVTGHGAIRHLSPQHRLSDKENWRTVELVLEGTIFLLMGLQLAGVLEELHRDGSSVGPGLGIAAVALVATVAVRSGYVSVLVVWLRSSARRGAERRPTLSAMDAQLEAGEQVTIRGRPVSLTNPRRLAAFRQPAAAPDRRHRLLPRRPPWGARGHVRWVSPAPAEVPSAQEQAVLAERLTAANIEVLDRYADDPDVAAFRARLAGRDGRPDPALSSDDRVRVRLEMIEAQRAALLDARDEGRFASSALTTALENLDAEQISLELRSRPAG